MTVSEPAINEVTMVTEFENPETANPTLEDFAGGSGQYRRDSRAVKDYPTVRTFPGLVLHGRGRDVVVETRSRASETVENRTSAREASSQRKGHITCPDANSKQVEIIPVDDFDLCHSLLHPLTRLTTHHMRCDLHEPAEHWSKTSVYRGK